MDEIDYKKKLKELKDAKGKGCDAFARYKNNTYFSINGPKKVKKIDKIEPIIKNMYEDNNACFCGWDDSVTIINPACENYILFTRAIETYFFNKKQLFSSDLVFPIGHNPKYNNRNWTCCERKIIGYLIKNHTMIHNYNYINDYDVELYVTQMPCALCIPLVHHVNYLDDNKNMIVDEYITKQIDYDSFEVERNNIRII